MILYGKVHGIAGTDHLRRDLKVALLWGTPIALAFGLIGGPGYNAHHHDHCSHWCMVRGLGGRHYSTHYRSKRHLTFPIHPDHGRHFLLSQPAE